MKSISNVILVATVILLCTVSALITLDLSDIMTLQESSGQICCKGFQSNGSDRAVSNNLKQLTSARGDIVSLQKNEADNIPWLAFGRWNASSAKANQTSFDAKFTMTISDGSETHKYAISNFSRANSSVEKSSVDHSSFTLNGTASLSLDSTKLNKVPISIKFMNIDGEKQIIKIWIDPSTVQNHFGQTPIYGTVSEIVFKT
jgi:hypothetical protein